MPTITTYLLTDNPSGIKEVWVENKNCCCTYFPRTDSKIAKRRQELCQPALYCLFGEELGTDTDKQVYIGETEDFTKRIQSHATYDFWNEALVFTAKDQLLTKSEVQYLECLAIEKASEARNYNTTQNKQKPKFPHLAENRVEIVKDFFNEIAFLSSFSGFNLFEDYEKIEDKKKWYCKVKGICAQGIYTGKKFILLKGSQIVKKESKSANKTIRRARETIVGDGDKAIDRGDYYELPSHIEINSPSLASSIVSGGRSNGWTSWKSKDGKTMDEVLRGDVKKSN